MAKVIINVDNDIIANSLALWFESGDAIDSWYRDNEDIIRELRADGENIPDIDSHAVVDFGNPDDWEMIHTVSLYEE